MRINMEFYSPCNKNKCKAYLGHLNVFFLRNIRPWLTISNTLLHLQKMVQLFLNVVKRKER